MSGAEWRARPTTAQEEAAAVAIAAGAAVAVGLTTWWLARTLLGRDAIRVDPPRLPPTERRRLGEGR